MKNGAVRRSTKTFLQEKITNTLTEWVPRNLKGGGDGESVGWEWGSREC